jgi:hypothetical protein
MKTIAICSSANFYRQAVDIQFQLEKLGYRVIIPASAERMKKSGDYDVDRLKSWFGNDKDYHKKVSLMRGHFAEIEVADSILVLNYQKNEIPNYIGGNVLMEMAIAFYLNKAIFILNDVPEESTFLEEIKGIEPIVLHGKLENISTSS